MPHPDKPLTPLTLRRALLILLLGLLVLLCAIVLQPLVIPITWAAILAYTSWPAHRFVRRLFRRRRTVAALAMTVLAGVVLVVPLFWLVLLLEAELAAAYQALASFRTDATPLPNFVRSNPWLNAAVLHALERIAADPLLIRQTVVDWAQNSRVELLGLVGGVGRNLAKLFLALVTVFFFYRDGDVLVAQVARVLNRFLGNRLDRHLHTAGRMTRAVVYGLLITALLQGVVGGIGYKIFGVEAPVLLGGLTALASIVPIVGTLLVWGSIGLWLIMTERVWPGIGLLAWGALLVQPADNLVRPLLISSATQMPFLLVMFGVIGGLAAFGLIGLFIGPVVLAIATAVWRDWLQDVRSGPSTTV